MFAIATMPAFPAPTGDMSTNPSWNHKHSQNHYRPSASSPLSSSPIRATSPLSPRSENDLNYITRQTQSSPISSSGPASKYFRYATRQIKPNPRQQRREEAQESRRKLFLQNVRQRADDRTYQRRDVEGKLLKSSWDREMRQRILTKRMEGDAFFSEADIDDAAEILIQERQREDVGQVRQSDANADEMMVDEIALQEERELEALLMSYDERPAGQQSQDVVQRPDPPSLSDDEDYDAIFMELASGSEGTDLVSSQQMDIS
ncbi:hypothetical protein SODALDRAFT_330968 [Sodiomyces alkalinus F11]|uniref:Uncharacterized protein n=1 Tax=Sodiomyces alkalinus (strain CBS 110278 / VKM F-3762 / F11) TaxID=1314773 RepID=A0A3N2Q395_SODAK|nr:hypothetical protein SODALDRAFT_330968 [Sodiomyces alkalinus F11]ROT41244.1 hypothetical protein SODALDRAFT_330968 [Sodiomyces alkalinus F11]